VQSAAGCERTLIKALVARISEISVCTGRAGSLDSPGFAETVSNHLLAEDAFSRIEIEKNLARTPSCSLSNLLAPVDDSSRYEIININFDEFIIHSALPRK